MRELARTYNIPMAEADYVWREFQKFDIDGSGHIEKDEFIALMEIIYPRHMSEFELEQRWKNLKATRIAGMSEVRTGKGAIDAAITQAASQKAAVDFEQFLVWFWNLMTDAGY